MYIYFEVTANKKKQTNMNTNATEALFLCFCVFNKQDVIFTFTFLQG